MAVVERLRRSLEEQGVAYEVAAHPERFNTQEVAAAAHVSGKALAKIVMVKTGGGFAMAASPPVVKFVGAGGLPEVRCITQEMAEITVGASPVFRMPTLDDQGTPSGIDIRKAVETGILPLINTGIAHRKAGVGQVGAGVVRAPFECFAAALEAFAEKYGGRGGG